MALPRIVSRDEWLESHKEFLVREKEATRARDALNAARRELPMVEVDKEYLLEGPTGETSLLDMFEGRRQLIVYHFMFHPDWDEGCPACSFLVDNFGNFAHLHRRDTSLAVVSRAPFSKLLAYKERMGWDFTWYSSGNSDFNYDFHTTLDDAKVPVWYNFKDREALVNDGLSGFDGMEVPGASVFLRDGDRIFHTYSTYARGTEVFDTTYHLLDLTALGRQEEWEKPSDRYTDPVRPILRHDEYESE
ncbi:DUF899 domain-containing protein [Nocardiopsis sp. YSL2]|uniref:DUF899 domain-containing protein n=1 Tax=Nocardiopsis sp. YSL2 TaxID=2939492 RepID=UPI0026F41E3D|nr:DUF899 domain-containing protein [Nocardiopsis sp. YSL2]